MFMQAATAFTAADMVDVEAALFPSALSRSGFIQGTKVEAAPGWRPVESLTRGDAVFTFDGGLREIRAIHREEIRPVRVVNVPGGVLDNCAEMVLMPGQHMLLELPGLEAIHDNALALLPAAALAGWRGVEWANAKARKVEIVTLIFDEEELVWGNSGALFHCPDAGQYAAPRLVSKFFNVLDMAEARQMLVGETGDGDNAWPRAA